MENDNFFIAINAYQSGDNGTFYSLKWQFNLFRLATLPPCHPATAPTAAPVLRVAHLDVRAGEQLAVIGPSGVGKTTLLQVLACALSPLWPWCRLRPAGCPQPPTGGGEPVAEEHRGAVGLTEGR